MLFVLSVLQDEVTTEDALEIVAREPMDLQARTVRGAVGPVDAEHEHAPGAERTGRQCHVTTLINRLIEKVKDGAVVPQVVSTVWRPFEEVVRDECCLLYTSPSPRD